MDRPDNPSPLKLGPILIFYAYYGTETLYKQIYTSYSIDFVYAQGLRIATIDSSSGHPISFSTIKYFHTDALGNIRLVTLSSTSVSFANGYQPYGRDNGLPVGSSTEKFTGKPYSTATGLYYDYQRWYDPNTGRFISPDAVKGHKSTPQSLNLYTYVQNSPLNGLDPTGLSCFSSLGDFGGCLWSSTIGAGIESYNWYQTASDQDSPPSGGGSLLEC